MSLAQDKKKQAYKKFFEEGSLYQVIFSTRRRE